jgi:hypothetical protein
MIKKRLEAVIAKQTEGEHLSSKRVQSLDGNINESET